MSKVIFTIATTKNARKGNFIMVESPAGSPRVDPSFDYLKSFMLPNRFENFERLAKVKGRGRGKVKLKERSKSITAKIIKCVRDPVRKELLVKGSLDFRFFGERRALLR